MTRCEIEILPGPATIIARTAAKNLIFGSENIIVDSVDLFSAKV